ncbi:MAG TPA: hypothetical protein VGK94_08330 [Candidatus Polarisedimenticolia bacterium]
MSNRNLREPIRGLFTGTSIGASAEDHPDLPGLALYDLQLGICDTRIDPDDARAEFSRLVSLIHARQEAANRSWLEDKVGKLCFPLDPQRRSELLAGVKQWLEAFRDIPAPNAGDVALRRIFEIAARELARPGARLTLGSILRILTEIYGPAFTRHFPLGSLQLAYRAVRKQQAKLIAERDRLRKLHPQSAQQL